MTIFFLLIFNCLNIQGKSWLQTCDFTQIEIRPSEHGKTIHIPVADRRPARLRFNRANCPAECLHGYEETLLNKKLAPKFLSKRAFVFLLWTSTFTVCAIVERHSISACLEKLDKARFEILENVLLLEYTLAQSTSTARNH